MESKDPKNASDDDDWENEWEDSLAQLNLEDKEDKVVAKAPAQEGPAKKDEIQAIPEVPGVPRGGSVGRQAPPSVTKGRICDHVLEVYNIPAHTSDLDVELFLCKLADERNSDAKSRVIVRMVDDCHAVGIFQSSAQARNALSAGASSSPSGGMRLRPFAEASAAARRLPDSELQPPKARPKTTSAVARRMLGSALGMNLRDKAADKELADQRREKRQAEKARKAAQQDIWSDE